MTHHTEEEILKETDDRLVTRWILGVYLFALIMGIIYL